MLNNGGGTGPTQPPPGALADPLSPRITRDLERRRGPAVVDAAGRLLARNRGQLAAVFAFLMTASVALAFAARPENDLITGPGTPSPSTVGGLAASLPLPPAAQGGIGGSPNVEGTGGERVQSVDQLDGAPTPGPSPSPPDASSSSIRRSTTTASASPPASATSSLDPTSESADGRSDTSDPETSTPTTSVASTSSSSPSDPVATTTSTAPPAPTTTISFRSINLVRSGSFEQPKVADGAFEQFKVVSGWTATGPIEIWGTGHSGVTSYRGRQHLELNSTGPTTISQRVGVEPGGTYTWSFAHRGRRDVNAIEFLFDGKVIATSKAGPDGWAVVKGVVVIPRGQTTATIALRAVDEGSSANLVDAITFARSG